MPVRAVVGKDAWGTFTSISTALTVVVAARPPGMYSSLKVWKPSAARTPQQGDIANGP